MIIPDKTVAFIPVISNGGLKEFDMNISTFLKPLNKNHKRDWFTSHFYKCLPLAIGNMQGFVFSVPFDFEVIWNGGPSVEDLSLRHFNIDENLATMNHVYITSEFGHGIITVHFPVILKTPPGVNLMTIAAPNFPLPGISPMTGVVETDNLRFTFTLNLKVDIPNVPIFIGKDYPIMGILPIPRYFCDSFELVNAYDILDKDLIEEERRVSEIHNQIRIKNNSAIDKNNEYKQDKLYYKGKDALGNKFNDHQLPGRNK